MFEDDDMLELNTVSSLPVLGAANDIRAVVPRKLVDCPSWGVAVWLQGLDGLELDEYRQPMYVIKDTKLTLSLKENTLRLLAMACRNEKGERIWPNTRDGIKAIGKLPAEGSEQLAKVARKLSAIGDDDEAELEGNFGAGRTGDSRSD